MDVRMRRSLDEYITGGRYHTTVETLECQKCSKEFNWNMAHEYGGSWFDPEDVVCPHCGELQEDD